jgi:hypothetical protein
MLRIRIHETGFARSWIRIQNVHQRDFPIGNPRANQQGSFQPSPHAIRSSPTNHMRHTGFTH